MTDEQRKRVADSLWVVNTALKEQGLGRDKDLKQDALLWLCKCAQRFDATRGVKWTTYAYLSVYLRIKRLNDNARRKEALERQYEANAPTSDNEDEHFARVEYQRIYSKCSEREKTVLDLRYAGYTWNEVSERLNCTHKKAREIWDSIREKAKEIVRND